MRSPIEMFKNNPLPFALVFFVCLFAGVSLFSGGRSDATASRSTSRGGSREMPDVSGVTAIEFDVPYSLVLSQGADESLTVSPAIDPDEIEVTVVGSTLRVRQRERWDNLSPRNYTFTLRLKGISSLSASAASEVDASPFVTDSLYLSASGASDVEFASLTAKSAEFQVSGASDLALTACDARRLSLGCSGSGTISIGQCASDDVRANVSGSSSVSLEGSGSVAKVDLDLSGASDFDAERLSATDVSAIISGGSEAVVDVSGTLVANVSGAGELRYLGSPTVDSETSGGGKVSRK